MKLDKNGWGTMEMLLLCGGLLLALMVAIFFISQLYGSLGGAVGNKQYIDLENSLEEAANRYIEDKNVAVNGESLGVDGYLDIGLIDTMKDLIVNFIGAVVFSIIGFFYVKSRGKSRFAKRFIPTVNEKEPDIEEDDTQTNVK